MKLEQLLPPSTQARLKRARFGGEREAVGSLIGNYQSAFKGAGLTFSELREYAPGDEVRSIDWKASARSNRTYVRSYEEERQLKILIALDISASMSASISATSRQRSVEFCALLAYLAKQSHDALGLCLFSDQVELLLPPATKQTHWRQVTNYLSQCLNTSLGNANTQLARQTSLPAVINELKPQLRNKTCIFIVSDFLISEFHKELRTISSRHLTTCVHITPNLEQWLPKAGLIQFTDAEVGTPQLIDSSNTQVRAALENSITEQRIQIKEAVTGARANYLAITDKADEPFFRFLKRRSIR